MARVKGLAVALVVLILLDGLGLGLQVHSYLGLAGHPEDLAVWSRAYIGLLCLETLELVVDVCALVALITKKHRNLLLPWILWHSLVCVLFIISLALIPLALVWYFWIQATCRVFASKLVSLIK